MYIYRMLIINRMREYKRFFSNMLFPVLSLIVIFLWLGCQFFCELFPILENISDVNWQIFLKLQIVLSLYSVVVCFTQKKALIILKPITLLLFGEVHRCRFIRIKYALCMIKHLLVSAFLALCTRGIHWDVLLLQIMVTLYSYLEITSILKWRFYHQNKRELWSIIVFWSLATGIFFITNLRIWTGAMNLVLLIALYFQAFFRMPLNWMKYEDEMQFQEKVSIAQNFSNTVLLSSYAIEKRLHNIKGRKKLSRIGRRYPLIWKSAVSILRLGRTMILGGLFIFAITFAVYEIPFFWKFPLVELKEIREILLIFGMLVLYQLTIQSMLREMDNLLEKSKEGLFLPLKKGNILIQITAIPMVIIIGISLLFGILMHTGFIKLLTVLLGMSGLTWGIFTLELTRKGILQKYYFIVSIIILCVTILFV